VKLAASGRGERLPPEAKRRGPCSSGWPRAALARLHCFCVADVLSFAPSLASIARALVKMRVSGPAYRFPPARLCKALYHCKAVRGLAKPARRCGRQLTCNR